MQQKQTHPALRALGAGIAAALALGALPAAAASYSVTALPNGATCGPTAISDTGIIIGACNDNTAVVWSAKGTTVSLGRLPGGTYSLATAVNNAGFIAGEGDTGNGRPQIWAQTASGLQNVFPNNGGNTHALFVGDNGFIGGFYTKSLGGSPSSWKGAIWTRDPKDARKWNTVDLPALPGGVDKKLTNSIPMAFNQLGQAAGYGQTDQLTGQHAVFWKSDAAHSIVDLGTLPGDWSSIAWGLNDAGQAVGESHPPFGSIPVLWNSDAAHTAVALPFPQGDNYGSAHLINNLGQVVGYSGYATPGTWNTSGMRQVIWRDGGVFDLASLLDPVSGAGWTVTYVASINNLGQMVGLGMHDGVLTAFLLTPQ
jgi:uncharacterized membrane protein